MFFVPFLADVRTRKHAPIELIDHCRTEDDCLKKYSSIVEPALREIILWPNEFAEGFR